MAAGIQFPALGSGHRHLLGAVDHLVVTCMRGEPEFPVAFDELDVALALGDVLLLFLPYGFRQVRQELRLSRSRIIAVELPSDVIALGGQHIVDLPVAGRGNGVVGVVRVGKAGIDALGRHLPRHRVPLAENFGRRDAGRTKGKEQAEGQDGEDKQSLHSKILFFLLFG